MTQPSPSSAPDEGLRTVDARYLCGLTALNTVSLSGGRVVVSLTALGQGLPTWQLGLLLALYSLVPMLLATFAGRWIDRRGVRIPLMLGTALLPIGLLAGGLLQTPVFLAFAIAMVGIGGMLYQIGGQSLMGRGPTHVRLRHYALSSLSISTAAVIGPLLAGVMIDRAGVGAAFVLLALVPVASFGILRRLREALATHGAAVPPVAAQAPRPRDPLPPTLWHILGVTVILTGAWDTHLFVVPLLGNELGLSATQIGTLLSAFAAGTFTMRLVLPWLQRRVPGWTLVRIAMGTTVLVFLVYPSLPWLGVLGGLSFGLGLALGGCQPTVLTMLSQLAPPGRQAELAGMRLSSIHASQTSMPLLFGVLGTVVGVAPLFWLYACVMAVGAWYWRHPPRTTG